MTDSRFWTLLDDCSQSTAVMASFCAALEQALSNLPPEELWSFDKWVWHYIQRLQWHSGMRFNEELNSCLDQAMGLQLGGDTGDCYAGWAIAQGREFYFSLVNQSGRAVERLPSWDDVWQGENVAFLASRVFSERTGQSLQEVFGADMSIESAPEA
jgi:hypothetical protein